MLIEFSVENFKCFAEKQTLDMRPDPDITSLDENLIHTGLMDEAGEELVLLPSVAIYGANASGKSSLIEAMFFFLDQMLWQGKKLNQLKEPSSFLKNGIQPFFASTNPILFNTQQISYDEWGNVDIIGEDINRQPIFDDSHIKPAQTITELTYSSKTDKIKSENLSYSIISDIDFKEKTIKWGYKNNSEIITRYRDEHDFGLDIEFFACRKIYFLDAILRDLKADEKGLLEETNDKKHPLIQMLQDTPKRNKLRSLLQKADFNIDYIDLRAFQYSENRTSYALVFGIKGQKKELYFNDQSEGTKKFLLIMPTVVHVLETGAVLLADELEAHLHPDLCRAIIELFNNPETNPKGSQLIFTTHNQDFMASSLMRPDQIYLVNKDQATGASELYRASDFEDYDWFDMDLTVQKAYHYGLLGSSPRVRRLTGDA